MCNHSDDISESVQSYGKHVKNNVTYKMPVACKFVVDGRAESVRNIFTFPRAVCVTRFFFQRMTMITRQRNDANTPGRSFKGYEA